MMQTETTTIEVAINQTATADHDQSISGIEVILDAARTHGDDAEDDQEIGDLQEYLCEMWELLTPKQKQAFVARERVRELLELSLGEADFKKTINTLEAQLNQIPPEGHVSILVQEGGSSGELYLHAWDTNEEAEQDRIDCSNGAYRTSPILCVPVSLADHPAFVETVYSLLGLIADLDYVEVDEEGNKDETTPSGG